MPGHFQVKQERMSTPFLQQAHVQHSCGKNPSLEEQEEKTAMVLNPGQPLGGDRIWQAGSEAVAGPVGSSSPSRGLGGE